MEIEKKCASFLIFLQITIFMLFVYKRMCGVNVLLFFKCFQSFIHEGGYALFFNNEWFAGFVLKFFEMFGDGLLLGCHLSFVIYEGVALGDMLKINGNRELVKHNIGKS
jgi:hypothetical protein